MTQPTQAEIRRTYAGAGTTLHRFITEKQSDVLSIAAQLDSTGELAARWRAAFAEYANNYRAARGMWNTMLSDGSPSWGSRLEAARLLKQTAVQAHAALRDLQARAERVPAVLRMANAAGFGTHLRALSAAGDVAASAARGIGAGLLALGAFAVFLVLGGKND